jgi:hypothetical protein
MEICASLNVWPGGQEYGDLEVKHNPILTESIKCISYEFG